MSNYRYLLFDAANTLIYKPDLLPNFAKVLQTHGCVFNTQHLARTHKLVSELINFPDTTNEEFYRQFNSEVLLAMGIIPNELLLNDLFNNCKYLEWKVFDDTKYLKGLSVEMAIVSNFNSTLNEKINVMFANQIHHIFASETLGLRKPSLDFYTSILNRLDVGASEVLYIGDSIKLDIMPAQTLGIKALLIDRDENYPDFSDRITSLREVNKFIH